MLSGGGSPPICLSRSPIMTSVEFCALICSPVIRTSANSARGPSMALATFMSSGTLRSAAVATARTPVVKTLDVVNKTSDRCGHHLPACGQPARSSASHDPPAPSRGRRASSTASPHSRRRRADRPGAAPPTGRSQCRLNDFETPCPDPHQMHEEPVNS